MSFSSVYSNSVDAGTMQFVRYIFKTPYSKCTALPTDSLSLLYTQQTALVSTAGWLSGNIAGLRQTGVQL